MFKQALIESPRRAGLLLVSYIGEIVTGFLFVFLERLIPMPTRLQWCVQAAFSLAAALGLIWLAAYILGAQTRVYRYSLPVSAVSACIGGILCVLFMHLVSWPSSTAMILTKIVSGLESYEYFDHYTVSRALILIMNAAVMVPYTGTFILAEYRGHRHRVKSEIDE